MRRILFGLVCLLALLSCSRKAGQTDPRVESLLARMTLEEKIGQLSQYSARMAETGPVLSDNLVEEIRSGRCGSVLNTYTVDATRQLQKTAVEDSRLGIPLLFGLDVIHGFRTIFPINLALAATWDPDAVEESARVAARESAASGIHWTFSPMCDIALDPRWGRISESSGEDPFLDCLMSAAMVRGYQRPQKDGPEDLADTLTLLSCVKHMAAYGAAQGGRDYNTVDMSERLLREVYLPAYKAAIDAGSLSVMTSFNEFDGVPATGNRQLMQDILRKEWGFKGFIVTDYSAIKEMVDHGYAADLRDAARKAIDNGIDMDMMSRAYAKHLQELVESGEVPVKKVDACVRRILEVKAKLGLLDDPYRYCSEAREKALIRCPEHLEASRRIAAESMVLLKNEGKLLPLRKGGRIALIGAQASDGRTLLSTWSCAGRASEVRTILAALQEANGADRVRFAPGFPMPVDAAHSEDPGDPVLAAEALRVAAWADHIVLVMGEGTKWCGEASSRSDIRLPAAQRDLLRRLRALGKPIVTVLLNGRPLDLREESVGSDALLEAWYPGSEGGDAVCDILFGEVNPSGRLPVTFPYNLGQIPVYHYAKNTGRPYAGGGGRYFSRYLDIPNEGLYPFGYGLSYSDFEYSDIALSDSLMVRGGSLDVHVSVTNKGPVAGIETVQLYLRDYVGSVTRPVRQLKDYRRVELQPGENRDVCFTLTEEDLAFWRGDMSWGAEPGRFRVMVGPSSADLRGADFTL